jgi:transposase
MTCQTSTCCLSKTTRWWVWNTAAGHLSPAGQLQAGTALEVLAALEARLEVLRRQLLHAAGSLTGARVLASRLYGVGPVAALAVTCWLCGAGRFSSSRKAVRFAGLDVTVWSSGRKGPPGRLSRQGPAVLRWAVFEARKILRQAHPVRLLGLTLNRVASNR